jgi:branched-chain amino acid transport system permease protein
MFYRENGQFKTSYRADQQIFPIRQDRIFIWLLLAVAFIAIPAMASDYLLRAILIPFLILALAAVGLNILVGYCGQISLGTGAFMAVGAYAAWNFGVRFPGMPLVIQILLGGFFATIVGVIFGIPSLRIRGLYLAVATLAAQFFVDWAFLRIPFFTNYSSSGNVSVPPLTAFGLPVQSALEKYLFVLILVVIFSLLAKNLVRGAIGRQWMAIRDMDVAASVIGIRPMYANLTRSFQLLFMVIIGGLGSIIGSFFGAAFIVLVPVALSNIPHALGIPLSVDTAAHIEHMVFGALIVFFLIAEPHGLARLWSIGKEKLRIWPFPH